MALTRTAKLKRTAAALLALLGWIALGLGYARFVGATGDQGLSSTEATVRFFSFFTIQTNILVALVLTAFAIRTGPEEWLVHPFVRSAVATYIVMVGIIYLTVLRPIEPLQNAVLLHQYRDALPEAGRLSAVLAVLRAQGGGCAGTTRCCG